jgi:hypothetical protein
VKDVKEVLVKGGHICPTCGLRQDSVYVDGSRILYGQGVGHLVVTEDGRRFIAKHLMEEWTKDILITCAWIAGQQHWHADDRVYMAARRLLAACVDDIPDRMK